MSNSNNRHEIEHLSRFPQQPATNRTHGVSERNESGEERSAKEEIGGLALTIGFVCCSLLLLFGMVPQ
jgi:hypothetical protein